MEMRFDDDTQDEFTGELSLYFTENFRNCTTRELCISFSSRGDFLYYHPSSVTERSFDCRTRQFTGWEDIDMTQENIRILTDYAMSKVTDMQLEGILRVMGEKEKMDNEEYEAEPEL